MASLQTLLVLIVALFAVTYAAEEAREKRGLLYGGYGAYPYAAHGYHGLGYSGLGYSGLGYSGLGYGYGLGYHGYHGLGYSYLH